MIYRLFDFDMTDKETIVFDPEREALWHVYTSNSMDSLYFIAPKDIDAEEEAKWAMRRRFGGRGTGMIREVVDESHLLTESIEGDN